jgi:alanine dehydrogenase
MPGAYARTATQALVNVTYAYIEALADFGLPEAARRHPELASGVNIIGGHLACKAVAEAHGLAYAPVSLQA